MLSRARLRCASPCPSLSSLALMLPHQVSPLRHNYSSSHRHGRRHSHSHSQSNNSNNNSSRSNTNNREATWTQQQQRSLSTAASLLHPTCYTHSMLSPLLLPPPRGHHCPTLGTRRARPLMEAKVRWGSVSLRARLPRCPRPEPWFGSCPCGRCDAG